MKQHLLVVTGTGTELGKTHLSEAILRAWGRAGLTVAGLKPIESGSLLVTGSDAARLRDSSTFHVKPFGHQFVDPVSPHLAARRAGASVDFASLASQIAAIRAQADWTLVELPGGLFSPLSRDCLNAHFLARLAPDRVLLVAPDRLGVLHDLLACTLAASTLPLTLDGIVLVTPAAPDPSTGTNAEEVAPFVSLPVLATLPRASVEDLAVSAPVAAIVAAIAST